jgi:hypothetical protein
MVKCSVLFEVRTEFINIIWTSFGFKELNRKSHKEVLLDTSKEVCLETNAGEAIYNKHIIYIYIYIYKVHISSPDYRTESVYKGG